MFSVLFLSSLLGKFDKTVVKRDISGRETEKKAVEKQCFSVRLKTVILSTDYECFLLIRL